MNSKILNRPQNVTSLNEFDFHPCVPFFIEHSLEPESFPEVYVKGVLETSRYLRETLKKIDYLLAVGGTLTVDYFATDRLYNGGLPLRPLSFMMYEVSLCFGERIKLVSRTNKENVFHLIFRKEAPAIPLDDSIDKWSFGIVSNGQKNGRIVSLIERIKSFDIPEYEVVICGPPPSKSTLHNVVVVDDGDLYSDMRIPISKKKNRLIQTARFHNLVLLHDRISFPDDWYRKMRQYGNYFDLLCTQTLDEETKSKRVIDWWEFDGDFVNFERSKGKPLSYDAWSPGIYVDGGYMIVKRYRIQPLLYNPDLNWGEAEDLDLSRRMYLAGVNFNLFRDCYVMSATYSHAGDPIEPHKIGRLQRARNYLGLVRNKMSKRKELGWLALFDAYLNQ